MVIPGDPPLISQLGLAGEDPFRVSTAPYPYPQPVTRSHLLLGAMGWPRQQALWHREGGGVMAYEAVVMGCEGSEMVGGGDGRKQGFQSSRDSLGEICPGQRLLATECLALGYQSQL